MARVCDPSICLYIPGLLETHNIAKEDLKLLIVLSVPPSAWVSC